MKLSVTHNQLSIWNKLHHKLGAITNNEIYNAKIGLPTLNQRIALTIIYNNYFGLCHSRSKLTKDIILDTIGDNPHYYGNTLKQLRNALLLQN